MKYMTKEWYETMQRTDFHLLLEISQQAETFSESYFKMLYKCKEQEFVDREKSVSQVRFEDLYPEEFNTEHFDGLDLSTEQIESMRNAYYEQRKQARKGFADRHSFDEDVAKKNFRSALRHNIANLKKALPEEILQNVADIRVLALDVASARVKKEIEHYCRQNERIVKQVQTAYWKQYKKMFKGNPPSFWEELRLHDCKLASCRKKGNDVVLKIDPTHGINKPDIRQVILKDCTVLKQDTPLHGSFFLYDEIYRNGEQYEIHFLLAGKRLKDFIVCVRDVEIYSDVT
ncbi:MAG: DUF4085 family protein [Clostridia bacterium]|nr:DUF4085 family protein [Clostridia bacterium]